MLRFERMVSWPSFLDAGRVCNVRIVRNLRLLVFVHGIFCVPNFMHGIIVVHLKFLALRRQPEMRCVVLNYVASILD